MAMLDALPLLRLPASWPLPVVATLCMAALAGLDLVGAFAAKEWAEKQNTGALGLGALSFLVLFWVYASSLQYAELAVVTMGWIVLLQVGILVIDRDRTSTARCRPASSPPSSSSWPRRATWCWRRAARPPDRRTRSRDRTRRRQPGRPRAAPRPR